MGARTKARKRAVDVIFEADQRLLSRTAEAEREPHLDEIIVEVLRERLLQPGTQTSLPEYSVEIVQGVSSHLARLDEDLATYSHGWTVARMPAVDRAILRVGAWELLFNDGVPDPVAVDEAVDLARRLSTDESPSFVNGLLGRMLQLKT